MSKIQNVGIVIQARTASSRLPKKIFLPILKERCSILQKIVSEACVAAYMDLTHKTGLKFQVIVACPSSDLDEIKKHLDVDNLDLCFGYNNVQVFGGDEQNVLKRFFSCAHEFNLDHIIRLTADCPLITGELIATCFDEYYKRKDVAFASNVMYEYDSDGNQIQLLSVPDGFDVEIFNRSVLDACYNFNSGTNNIDSDECQKNCEHVTRWIRNQPWIKKTYFDMKLVLKQDTMLSVNTYEDWLRASKFIEFMDYLSVEIPRKNISIHEARENVLSAYKQSEDRWKESALAEKNEQESLENIVGAIKDTPVMI